MIIGIIVPIVLSIECVLILYYKYSKGKSELGE